MSCASNSRKDTSVVAPLTTTFSPRVYPIEVRLAAGAGDLPQASSVLLNQIKTIDKERLADFIGQLDVRTMERVNQAIKASLGLIPL